MTNKPKVILDARCSILDKYRVSSIEDRVFRFFIRKYIIAISLSQMI